MNDRTLGKVLNWVLAVIAGALAVTIAVIALLIIGSMLMHPIR